MRRVTESTGYCRLATKNGRILVYNHRGGLNLHGLRDETIIVSQSGREIEDLLVSKLASPNERPNIEQPDVSRGVVKSLVTMGVGISIVLESDVGANFSGLVFRELRDGAGPSMLSYSAYWQTDSENPALETFLKLLAARYPSRCLTT